MFRLGFKPYSLVGCLDNNQIKQVNKSGDNALSVVDKCRKSDIGKGIQCDRDEGCPVTSKEGVQGDLHRPGL